MKPSRLILAALGCAACGNNAHAAAGNGRDASAPTAGAALVRAGDVHAQDSVLQVTGARLAQALASMEPAKTPTLSVARSPEAWVIEGRRVTSGTPELHRSWTDVVYVQAGRAMLETSGELTGAREVSAGELRGGAIRGGRQQPVGAGDVVVIPAGIPHQYLIGRGDSLVYLTVKVPPSGR